MAEQDISDVRRKAAAERDSESRRRLRHAELLLEVTRRMASYGTLDEVLSALVEMTTTELNAERGSLFLNDPDTNELYSRVAQGNIQREVRIGAGQPYFDASRRQIRSSAHGFRSLAWRPFIR